MPPASSLLCAATRARLPRGAPIRRACGSRVRAAFALAHSFSINQSFRDVLISVNPPISQKRPVSTLHVDLIEIAFCDQDLFFAGARLRDDLSRWIGDKALAPEFDAVAGMASRSRLVPDAIRNCNVYAVRDGVCPLDRLP